MTVRRLRKNQRGPKCSYCDSRAVYRGLMFTKFGCSLHKPLLDSEDAAQERRDAHCTEAEYSLGLSRF
jgi:hypothetical protein